jgi:predicted dehydrogenase
METVNWGIIGCGAVTELKSGPAFQKITSSKLVAVMRRDAEKAKDYAQRHKISKWYNDAQKLIDNPEVNAVYVATPPSTHAKYAIMAMNSGKPVYVEKPMALNYKECLEMIRVSEETGQKLFVAYYRRALPGFLKVKELMDAGKIGKVRYVNVRLNKPFAAGDLNPEKLQWRVDPSIAGGGYFFDLASHTLDYLDYLFGPIVKTNAIVENQGKKYSAEDIVLANFKFGSGVLGTGSWCFTADPAAEEDTLEFIGEKGKIVYSTFDPIPIRLLTHDKEEVLTYTNTENIQFNLIQSIVEELTGTGTVCPSSGISAARTSKVLDKIVQEYYKNQ